MRRKSDDLDDEESRDAWRSVAREKAIAELEKSSASVQFDARLESDRTAPTKQELRRSA